MPKRLLEGGVALLIAASVGMLAACDADRGSAPPDPVPADVRVAFGAAQEARAGAPLPDPIGLLVTNRNGDAVAGIRVDWEPQNSGSADPPQSVTGSDGIAKTRWTLGPSPLPGIHSMVANVNGYGTVTIPANAALTPLTINAVHELDVETPHGSRQTVHPDYVNLSGSFPLSGHVLAITSYPFGDAAWENPGLYTSADRVKWRAPEGGVNPVALPKLGYLSDPDLVFNPTTNELWMYYREVYEFTEVYLIRTSNGVTWSEPERVIEAFNGQLISPSVVRRSETEWLMWTVNGEFGCFAYDSWIDIRRSSDGRVWSEPERVSLAQEGFTPWHVEVQWIPSRQEYWALYNVKTAGSCTTPALYLATSPDGVMWTTYKSPVLSRGQIPVFRDIVYRSTFRYRPETDAITFYYSGATYSPRDSSYVWRSVVQRRQRASVFDAINRAPSSSLLAEIRRRVPPLITPP